MPISWAACDLLLPGNKIQKTTCNFILAEVTLKVLVTIDILHLPCNRYTYMSSEPTNFTYPHVGNYFLHFLISNFCHVLNVVFFPLGDSPASEFYVLAFQNSVSDPSS